MTFLSVIIEKCPVLSRALLWIGIPIIILFIGVNWYFRQSLPQIDGQIKLAGLSEPVTILRDDDAVIYIKGNTDNDAYFALGYAHAQDRMWQMEMNRRIAAGRISEIIGSIGLTSDRFSRTMGLYASANKTWQQLNQQEKESLVSYVRGINEWIDGDPILPIEYTRFQFTPEAWTVQDSLSWLHAVAWGLSMNLTEELGRTGILRNLGVEETNRLAPPSSKDNLSILSSSELSGLELNRIEFYQRQFNQFAGLHGNALGSNSWVISGDYTATGSPYLANDPHLQVSLPSPWYLAEIEGNLIHAKGATFPGLPFVVIGQNRSIAWGITNMAADVQDLYIERTNPLNSNEYELDGRFVPMQIRQEEINVRADFLKESIDSVPLQIRRTRHGPLISDLNKSGRTLSTTVYSLKWAGDGGLGGTYSAFYQSNYASNWSEFRNGLKAFVAPSQNFIYADNKGNIAYQAAGKIPVRDGNNGDISTIGWDSKNDWKGWIPFEQLPYILNPSSGFIVTANNKVAPDSYPYHLTSDWPSSYRAQRITDLIKNAMSHKQKLNIQDMISFQSDVKDLQVNDLLPHIVKIPVKSKKQKQALRLLKEWNGEHHLNSIAASIYQSWLENFTRLVFEDEIREFGLNGQNISSLVKSFSPRLMPTFFQNPEVHWCDHKKTNVKKESCLDIARLALDHAIIQLTELKGADMSDWKWGSIHIAHYPHFPFSNNKYKVVPPDTEDSVLESFFHREISSPGSRDTINVSATEFNDKNVPFRVTINPSYRQIANLADLDQSLFMINTGQSGNVFSKHYDDMIEKHRDSEYLKINRRNYKNQLSLVPAQ